MLEEVQSETIFPRPDRSERIQRSEAARARRKVVKAVKTVHQFKEEKDARERLLARRKLERDKRRARKKV